MDWIVFVAWLKLSFLPVQMALLTISSLSQAWDTTERLALSLTTSQTPLRRSMLPSSGCMRKEKTMQQKIRWLGKHKGYGWKSKVAIGPDGKARYVLPPYPGSFNNMKIFKVHLDKHLACLVKEDADAKESDNLSIDNKMIRTCGQPYLTRATKAHTNTGGS